MENCRVQPVGGLMPQTAWEAMLADALHPQGLHPPQPLRAPGPPVCPQLPAGDPSGDAKRRQARVGHHPKPNPAHTHLLPTPQASTHRHRQHPQHPGSPARHTAQRPWPSGQRRHHPTPRPSQAPPRNVTLNSEADGRQRARQWAPLRPTARNPSPQTSKPPNPPQPPSWSRSLITSRTRAAPRNL